MPLRLLSSPAAAAKLAPGLRAAPLRRGQSFVPALHRSVIHLRRTSRLVPVPSFLFLPLLLGIHCLVLVRRRTACPWHRAYPQRRRVLPGPPWQRQRLSRAVRAFFVFSVFCDCRLPERAKERFCALAEEIGAIYVYSFLDHTRFDALATYCLSFSPSNRGLQPGFISQYTNIYAPCPLNYDHVLSSPCNVLPVY
jgi:hypothetical protein